MLKRRVAVLRGGPSTEYDVSMQTGAGVIAALKDNNHDVKDIVISRAGEWLVHGMVKQPAEALIDNDVVFIAMHGQFGEDGTIQRLLERLGIPYTGSGPLASAIAMNKHLSKEHLKDTGIKLPKSMKLSREGMSDVTQTVDSIEKMFGPEYVVKPVNGGSSIDTIVTSSLTTLAASITDLLNKYEEILVEERIKGREATVGVLEKFRGENHYVLPAIEIVPPAKSDFFSADVKYTGETDEICPGRFSQSEKQTLSEAAKLVHKQLNLKQYSRSDFIVNSDGVYFLEVNTLPGLTSESLFPKSMTAVGSNYNELIEHLIINAEL